MTDHYDVERTITSLGTGEALVTFLSPRGIPTPLAATRLRAPDSLMAPLPMPEQQARIAQSLIATKYGAAIDRDSAHEIITARLAQARATAAELAAQEAARAGVEPTTTEGLNTMTPAQQRREIQRQAREIAAAQKAAERARKAEERRLASLERVRLQQERARQRQVETAIRTGGKVITSRVGQDIIRGVFGTLFSGRK
jgi:hypothetical protein